MKHNWGGRVSVSVYVSPAHLYLRGAVSGGYPA